MRNVKEIFTSFGIGNLLAFGMMTAGLTKRHQVLDFLSLTSHWNPSLLFVWLGAFLGYVVMSNYFPTTENIPANVESVLPAPTSLSPKSFIGSALLGIGKGMTGLCLGSALLVSPVYFPHVALFVLPSILIGQLAAGWVDNLTTTGPKSMKKDI